MKLRPALYPFAGFLGVALAPPASSSPIDVPPVAITAPTRVSEQVVDRGLQREQPATRSLPVPAYPPPTRRTLCIEIDHYDPDSEVGLVDQRPAEAPWPSASATAATKAARESNPDVQSTSKIAAGNRTSLTRLREIRPTPPETP